MGIGITGTKIGSIIGQEFTSAEADATYARLDGTNMPFTGAITAPTVNGVTLTTGGSASSFLNAAGNYVAVSSGVTSVSGTTNRITSTGGATPVIDIANTYVGQSSITTLGTITTGVWNGTAIANANLANSTISGVALGSNLAELTATNTTLTFSGSYTGATARTVGLNLGNANTWTAQQIFRPTTTSTVGTIFRGLASQSSDLVQFQDSSNNVRGGFSINNLNLFLGNGGSNSTAWLDIQDSIVTAKTGIRIGKYTSGTCLDLYSAVSSAIVAVAANFVTFSYSNTGFSLVNSFRIGASFDYLDSFDSYATYGVYSRGANLNPSPSVSGAAKRARAYGIGGVAQGSLTGTGGAGVRSIAQSTNIDGFLADVFTGQTAPVFRARLIDNMNDAFASVDTTLFTIHANTSTGAVTFDSFGSGAGFTFNDPIINTVPIRSNDYTVATLPTGVNNMRTFVTDALAPAWGVAVVGGGAVRVPVYFDGTWKVG